MMQPHVIFLMRKIDGISYFQELGILALSALGSQPCEPFGTKSLACDGIADNDARDGGDRCIIVRLRQVKHPD
jgi:hypothetical protein